MIVTCEECSTQFSLDDSLIKDDGSKVRCSVCKHIFTVFPTPPESEIETPLVADFDDTAGLDEDSAEETPFEDSDFSFDSSEIDFEVEDEESPEIEFEIEDSLSFDEDQSEVADDEASPLDMEIEELDLDSEDTLDFGEDALTGDDDSFELEEFSDDDVVIPQIEDDEAHLEIELEPDDDEEIEISEPEEEAELDADFELEFDVSDDEIPDPENLDLGTDLDVEPAEDDILEDRLPDDQIDIDDQDLEISQENDFSEYDEILEQKTDPDEDTADDFEPELAEEEETPEPALVGPGEDELLARPYGTEKKSIFGTLILILILIFLLIVGAYIASLMTGYKIPVLSDVSVPFLEKTFKKKEVIQPELKPIPNQKSVNGRFVTNSTAGTLFVITGKVENPAALAYSHIQVKGALIVTGKVEAKVKTAYCGNIVTEEMLKTGNIADINKILNTKEGAHNSNVGVKPGSSIPFMVVFSDLPDKLQNFTVKVTGFKKPDPGK